MAFLPATLPPTDVTGRARWYLVRDGELLTVGPDAFPMGEGPPEPVAAAAEQAASEELAALAGSFDTDPVFLGTDDGCACWARGVAGGTEAPDGAMWAPLRQLGASLPTPAWTVAGRAVQLVEWRRSSRFCGRCGAPTEAVDGERAMGCSACGLHSYPRLAPAVIVAVRRGRQILLARNARFRGGTFSVLAGFVEPGETLEDAVRREVAEEVGVRLGAIEYFASQPWPFPHSLMVGFVAEWESGEILVDGVEIAEAGWFSPDGLPDVPPPLSIARRLIDAWAAGVAAG